MPAWKPPKPPYLNRRREMGNRVVGGVVGSIQHFESGLCRMDKHLSNNELPNPYV